MSSTSPKLEVGDLPDTSPIEEPQSDTITLSGIIDSLPSIDLSSINSISGLTVGGYQSGYGATPPTGVTTSMPTYTINTSGMNSGISYGSINTITTGVGTTGYSYPTFNQSTPSIDVKGDANFEGDIKWQGRSLSKLIESIEDRLAILQPNLEKMEKFAALKKAYEHYKLMEKLCQEEPIEEKK
jgi:hypothetical protein